MTDVILAWLCAEDDGARSKIKEALAEKKETLEALKATLNGKSGQTKPYTVIGHHNQAIH
jgi:hypothetical protein